MIVKNYNVGWGTQWALKKLEQKILDNVLEKYHTDNSRTVTINSVWYNDEYHQEVMQELHELKPTRVVVVALIDPPITKLEWFKELGCEVIGVGYYPGSDVDYWAEFMHNIFKLPECNLLDPATIDTPYMCLNRKPHYHRMWFYHALENANILDCGFVSMGGDPPKRLLPDDVPGQELAPNWGSEQYGMGNDIASLGNINRWQRHFINIVTETTWDVDQCNFLSEKTFKPILGLRPFFIYAPNGGIECLRRRGFEPYVDDFKDIVDIDLKETYNVVELLKIVCQQPQSYWQMKFEQLKDKLLFNQNHFYNTIVPNLKCKL